MEVTRYDVATSAQFEIVDDSPLFGDAMIKEADHLATIAELTRELDELREASRWIPVSERLPDCGIPVQTLYHDEIAGDEKPMLAFAVRDKKGWLCFVSDNDAWDVTCYTERWHVNHPTHWQPLPKAPL